MNNALRNLILCSLPTVMLAVSSLAISQEALNQNTRPVTLVQMEIREAATSQSGTESAIAEDSRFCYQGNELISCKGAPPAVHETKTEGAVPPPPMFDLEVLLGDNAS